MLSSFLTVAEQVVILFVLIGVGFVCGKTNLVKENAVKGMTNLVLYFATPCVIITSFQKCEFSSDKVYGLLLMVVISALIHIVSIVIASLCFRQKDIAQRAVLRVATIFSNCGFMSLPLQKAILGNDGVFYGAIYVAMFNIFVWTYGLVTMSGNKKDLSLQKLVANPGVIGVVVGILLWMFNIHMPTVIYAPVDYLGSLNTPVPMLIIGCQLASANLKVAFKDKFSYLSMGLRLIAIPVLTLAVLVLCGVDGSLLVATVIATSAPSAATTTMFATKYDRDTSLSVSLVSVTTLISIISMPVIVALAQMFA